MDNILEKWLNQWTSDGVRILILISLTIQIGLTVLAPLRKRSRSTALFLTIWVFYLTAELVTPLALGNMGGPAESDDLTVLWAPFLLLHLGGPDSITSLSIDDNELWWRLPSGLVVQVIAAIYAFRQSPPNPVLWIPTTFVCIAGMIKFVERTLALRSGSRNNIKDTIMMEINPANDMKKVDKLLKAIRNDRGERETEMKDHAINDEIISEHGDGLANETEVSVSEWESMTIAEGYIWFDIFKRLLVDVTFSSNLLKHSQDRFSVIDKREAINLITIELSFIYDILHTKAIQKSSNLGRVLHFSSLLSIIAALAVFDHLDLQKYASIDITITYILFGAGLTLEVIATFLLVTSDWTVVSLRKTGWRKRITRVIAQMVNRIIFEKGKARWSETIGQFNLVGLCLRDRYAPRTRIMKKLIKIKHKWDNMRESRSIPSLGLLEDYIVIQAIKRAPKMDIYNEVVEARSCRGRKALENHGQLETLEWSMNREFDECIILWHVATDICYYNGRYPTEGEFDVTNDTERDVSWMISNYMMYLLTQQQLMMQVGYGQTRLEVTCAVVKKILRHQRKLDEIEMEIIESRVPHQQQSTMQLACAVVKKIFKGQRHLTDTTARKVIMEGARSKKGNIHIEDDELMMNDMDNIANKKLGENVLKDIRLLAKQLQELRPEIQWKLISETWMEMLGYAAIHCDSNQHAKSLSRGGELLTAIWLLMAQLGIVEEYKMQQFQSDDEIV